MKKNKTKLVPSKKITITKKVPINCSKNHNKPKAMVSKFYKICRNMKNHSIILELFIINTMIMLGIYHAYIGPKLIRN